MRHNDFVSMVDVIPEARLDGCAIEHYDVDEHNSMLTQIQAMQHGPDAFVPLGRYCRLKVGQTLMMSDTPLEQRSNTWFVLSATGDVFIAGLGMVLIPVLRKKDVRSVTVIEKYQAVIDLVEPSIRKRVSSSECAKLQIICEDIFDWKFPKGQKWETIYFDIWADICSDNLPEITKLKRRFARRLQRENKDALDGRVGRARGSPAHEEVLTMKLEHVHVKHKTWHTRITAGEGKGTKTFGLQKLTGERARLHIPFGGSSTEDFDSVDEAMWRCRT